MFDGTNPEEPRGLVKELESDIVAAKEHVTMHMTQREKPQVHIRKAIQDLLGKLPFKLMIMALTGNETKRYRAIPWCGSVS